MSERLYDQPLPRHAVTPSILDMPQLAAITAKHGAELDAIYEEVDTFESASAPTRSRKNRRTFPNAVEVAGNRFSDQAVLVILDVESDAPLREIVEDTIVDRVESIGHNATHAVDDIMRSAALTQLSRNTSAKITSAMNKMFDEDKLEDQFLVMRILSQIESNDRGEKHDYAASIFQETVLFEDAHNPGSSIINTLVERVEEGDYDHLIARDLLNDCEILESDNDISRLKQLFVLQGMSDIEATQVLSQSEAVDLWPTGATKLIDLAKTTYKTMITDNKHRYTESMKRVGIVIGTSGSEEALDRSFDAYALARRRARLGGSVGKRTVAGAHAPSTKKRSNRRRARATANGEQATVPEVLSEPRSVVFIDSQHQEQPLSSEAFVAMRQKYLDGHRGDKKLIQDVDNVINWLASVDLSAGPIFGIKKYHHSVKIGEESHNLYSLKPKDAIGLTTSSPHAKKMRLLFSLSNNTAKILKIFDRDEMLKTERSLGINSSAS